MLATLPLVLSVLAALTAPPDRQPQEVAEVSARLGRVYLRIESIDEALVRDAVRLRIPHVALLSFDGSIEAPTEGSLAALVEVRPAAEDPGALSLTIITSDGRAYDRRITVGTEEDPSRVVAGAVAGVLLGIESGTVVPDRGEVPLPVATPCPECPSAPAPAPALAPAPASTSAPAASPDRSDPGAASSVDVGLRAAIPLVIAAGPADAVDRFAAWAGEVGPMVRLRRGALLGAGVRIAGRRVGDVGLVRARLALGAGWVLRRDRLELETSGWLFAEPWWARRDGDAAQFQSSSPSRTHVLLGAAARVGPGLLWGAKSGRVRARFGAFAELSASAMPSDEFRVPRVIVPGGDGPTRAVAVGGVEGAFGFDVTLWFPAPHGSGGRDDAG